MGNTIKKSKLKLQRDGPRCREEQLNGDIDRILEELTAAERGNARLRDRGLLRTAPTIQSCWHAAQLLC